MQWFRFYSEALDDPKVQRLPGDLFKAWVNLLCLANEQEERGTLPPLDDIAFRLRLDHLKAEDALTGLRRAGLLEHNTDTDEYRVHAWDKRQYASDLSTDRVRKFREKQRETAHETERNKSETFQKRSRNAIDTDTEAETDQIQRQKQSISPPAGAIGGAGAPRHTPKAPTPLRPAPKPKDAPPKERPRDLLFEAVCEVCLIDWHHLTERERGKYNAAVGQIRGAGGTPDAVPIHAANYRAQFSTPLTPMALAGNWAMTANSPPANLNGHGHGRRETLNDRNERAFQEAFGDEPADVPTVIEATWRRH
jgi:hypothetical protein